MATTVLNFVIVGHEDHPIYESDLSVKDPSAKEDRAQYLHQVLSHASAVAFGSAVTVSLQFQWQQTCIELPIAMSVATCSWAAWLILQCCLHITIVSLQFVLHAALDAVDEQQWTTPNMHLGVVDKFHNLQVLRFFLMDRHLLSAFRLDNCWRSQEPYACFLERTLALIAFVFVKHAL